MQAFEIKLKVICKEDMENSVVNKEIQKYIDSTLANDEKWKEFHNTNKYKNYNYDSLYPIEKDKVYKKNKIYSLRIRTVDKDLAAYLTVNLYNKLPYKVEVVDVNVNIIPKKHIEKIYSITPVVIKNDEGYWKGILSLDEYIQRIKENAIKKYNIMTDEKIDEDFPLYKSIEFKNNQPIGVDIKEKKLLGDKFELTIADDPISQKIAYLMIGSGVGELNARGAGFVGYRWI